MGSSATSSWSKDLVFSIDFGPLLCIKCLKISPGLFMTGIPAGDLLSGSSLILFEVFVWIVSCKKGDTLRLVDVKN